MGPQKVVCIGGGTGTYTALSGLKECVEELAVVVSIADDGGSSGILRDEFGILPPGDVRRALLALSDDHQSKLLRQLFSFRFDRGRGLNGHSFGNLLLTVLTQITGREDKAIEAAAELLKIRGRVLPVSLESTRLCARLEDGTIIKGETNIDIRRVRPELRIIDAYLDPPVNVFPPAAEAIFNADVVVIGPGDLYTSVIPNLLVEGISKALRESKAKRIYVCNLMTKRGETDDFKASDFIREVLKYLGGKFIDVVVVSKSRAPRELLERYREEGAFPVEIDISECQKLAPKIVVESLAAPKMLLRHDPRKLAKVILRV